MLIRYVETGAFSAVETHNRYTLLNRCAEPLLDVASRMGVAVINGAPYGSGILAKGPDAYARYAYSEAPPIVLERARSFAKVCQEFDVPLAAAAQFFLTSVTNANPTNNICLSPKNELGHPIGTIQLYDIANRTGFLATWIGVSYFGQGYNRRAKEASSQNCFLNMRSRRYI